LVSDFVLDGCQTFQDFVAQFCANVESDTPETAKVTLQEKFFK